MIVARIQNSARMRPFYHPELTLFNPWPDARWFNLQTPYGTVNPATGAPYVGYVPYPAAGAQPVVVLSYVVPPALIAVIKKMAIINQGMNPPDGSGNVIWQVTVNGAALKGLNNQLGQIGTMPAPLDTQIVLWESDVIQVTAQCPVGAIIPPGTTAASFLGWTYPLVEATYKRGKQ